MIDETLTLRPGRPKDPVKRDEIVTAATDLFMLKGYELTSIEAVAKLAGVSKLTIYSHFADKNELFRAIVQNRCDKIGMPRAFEAEALMPVKQALLQIATFASANIFREDSLRLMRMIQAEAARHPEIIETYYEVGPRRVKRAFAELLRAFDKQGQLKIPDPVLATEQFFSLLKGERLMRTLMMMAAPPSAEELARHAEATVAFFLSAYQLNISELDTAERQTSKTETP
jgi:TetR/AcrR family transcriptional repressor of mexJK operon